MDNIFRGEILREVKYVQDTAEWVVNGKIIITEGLSETEKLTLESFSGSTGDWQLLKGETKIKGNLLC